MVLYIMNYDVRAEKMEAFVKWAKESAIPRILKIPGLKEYCSYRPVTGAHQIGTIFTFKDMPTCAAWLEHPDALKLTDELRSFAYNLSREIWGPSPVVPEPLRPKK